MSSTFAALASAIADRYTIDREIGRGGMATVYLARDVRHHRHVALKVLNAELGAVLGVERFLAEIEVTASLQHPNLLPLFDSGEAGGLLFYVMPYVDGESLRKRLDREKQLPVDEAIRIATAICGALDYAHRHNVIHRDLKPENVLLHEGQPLIADFGIALAVSKAGGERITQTGLSLGTPQYMSPEQATGDRVVDGRADIYSLGAITYEMLAGDPPHAASTAQAIIAKVLTERPRSVRASRPSVAPHVDAAIARALEKLAADRFATAREFADALQGRGVPQATPLHEAPVVVRGGGRRVTTPREIAAWTLAAVLVGWLGWQHLRPRNQVDAPVVRASFDLPPGTRVTDALIGTTIAVSPKGDKIVFTANGMSGFPIYLRRVNELGARQLVANTGRNLTFSPDGRWLAFTEGNVVKKVSVDGGEAIIVSSTGSAVPYGLTWSPADTIYVGGFSGMSAVSAAGGNAVPVGRVDSTGTRIGQRWPIILPGGRAIAYGSGNSSADTPQLSVIRLGSGQITTFDVPISMPLGVLGDQLVYVSPSGGLMAIGFDASALRPVGEPIQLEEGLLVDPTGGAKASLSASGTLAYLRGRAQFQPVLAGTGAAVTTPLLREPGSYANPRFSPDGRRLAVTVYGPNATDIWVYDIGRNTFTRLTTEGQNIRPEWTPDGRHVVFISRRNDKPGIWRQPADGSGPAELLHEPEVEPFEAIVSPDTQWIVFRTAPGLKYSRDILAVPFTGPATRTVTPLVVGPFTESLPRLSPDGKWLAYQSSETNRFEVFVRPFPSSGARVQVSNNGGTEPVWGRSGRALYYRSAAGEIIEVNVTTGSAFSIGARRVALTGDYLTDASHANYDIAPDGRFLVLKRSGEDSRPIVVHNWGQELRQKTARRR